LVVSQLELRLWGVQRPLAVTRGNGEVAPIPVVAQYITSRTSAPICFCFC
jgi:hypothetical protein